MVLLPLSAGEWFADVKKDFIQSFIEDDRWKLFVEGLGITLEVTALSLVMGLAIGVVVAIIRSTYDQQHESMRGAGKVLLKIFNTISNIYLTVIRGTPAMVQLLIMYFVIFASSRNIIMVAVLTFGINSGAYVAEIFRSGIMAVDRGQMEAGRSLGFGYVRTMQYIVIPQAFKNVLPALGNELITLFKETSIVAMIGLRDLTKAAINVQSVTYQAFMPFIGIAVIYLLVVLILTRLLGVLERRLRTGEH